MFRPALATLAACGLAALNLSCAPPSAPAPRSEGRRPLIVRWEQEEQTDMKRMAAGPDDYPARIVVDDVLIYYPEEKAWKACSFNGEAWVAPKDAERRATRVTGYFEEGRIGLAKPGCPEIGVSLWCDSPKGIGHGTAAMSTEVAGERIEVTVWPRNDSEFVPYLDPFSSDGPMVDIDLSLFQSTPNGRGGRDIAGMVKLKAMVAYQSR